MSDFVLVVPDGWTPLDWEKLQSEHSAFSKPSVEDWLATGQLFYMCEQLVLAGAIPEGSSLVDARLIDDTYFLVKLG